jgi:hypothetical protein
MSRYANTKEIINNDRIYATLFKNRGVSQVQQFGTRFLRYPSQAQVAQLNLIAHTWAYGDMYYKLAHENYGDPTMWWVIAFFNQRPTEAQLRFGSIIYVPHPLERVLNFYGV